MNNTPLTSEQIRNMASRFGISTPVRLNYTAKDFDPGELSLAVNTKFNQHSWLDVVGKYLIYLIELHGLKDCTNNNFAVSVGNLQGRHYIQINGLVETQRPDTKAKSEQYLHGLFAPVLRQLDNLGTDFVMDVSCRYPAVYQIRLGNDGNAQGYRGYAFPAYIVITRNDKPKHFTDSFAYLGD